tara:strand:+ start:31 stop:288 length:258 start_codon:yes stop_codon:yes gene_type:complete
MKTEIKTAEEFLIRQGCQRMCCDDSDCNGVGDFFEDVQPKDLIEFAKLHCKAQLEAIFEEVKKEGLVTDAGIAYLERAYNLDNIK